MTKKIYRIGLLEIKCANHELAGLCKIANTENTKVTVFTTNKLFPQAEEELHGEVDDYEWIFDKERETWFSFLKRIEKICNERIDLLIINSLRTWEFLFFNPKCKKFSIISNLNYWFRDPKSIKWYFKKLFKWQNLCDLNPMANSIIGPFIRNKTLSYYDGVIVEYPTFIEEIKNIFKYPKKVYWLPNRPFEGLPKMQKNKRIIFAIPGMIAENRRDYFPVLKIFAELFPKYKDTIKVYLLGKPLGEYGKKVTDYCEKLIKKGYKIYCPSGYVPAHFLEKTLYISDVILAPLRLQYHSKAVEEIYTYTKGTGTFSDSVKYAKPVIVPAGYNVADIIKTSYLKYKNEDELTKILETLITDSKKLKEFQKEAIKNSEKLTLEKLHRKIENLYEENIK